MKLYTEVHLKDNWLVLLSAPQLTRPSQKVTIGCLYQYMEKAMENKLGTRDDYQRAFNAWVDACRIYDKAIANQECACENMYYIETADETNRGCQALYRIDDGISQCDKPCKIGEPIVNNIW